MNVTQRLKRSKSTSKNMNIAKLVSGFTIAEILLAFLISSVLIAAMVPIVGVKKIKRPTVRYNHGIAECYYDVNGNLQTHIQTNRNGSGVTITKNGDYCTLKIPNNQFLQVFVIGAGGNSGGDTITYQGLSGTAIEGTINVGNSYQADIQAAESRREGLSSILREALNNWSSSIPGGLKAVYTITSPLGRGGYGMCRPERINNSEDCMKNCANGFNNGFCLGPLSGKWYSIAAARNSAGNYCWAYIHGKGQRSGYGAKNKYEAVINGDSQINITENTTKVGVSVLTNNSVSNLYLTPSGNGNNPVVTSDGYTVSASSPSSSQCSSTNPSACYSFTPDNSFYSPGSDGGYVPPAGFGCQSNYLTAASEEKAGSVTYAMPTFTYRYTPLVFVINQAEGGTPGEMQSKIYEKLSGTLRLRPARDISQKSYISVRDSVNGNMLNLLTAKSGTNGARRIKGVDISRSEFPIVTSVKDVGRPNNKEHFAEYLAKINALNYNSAFRGCENAGTCPGFAGNGAYLYLTGALSNLNTLTITNRQNNTEYKHSSDSAFQPNATGCEDSDTMHYITSYNGINMNYCKTPNGT